MYVYLPPPPTHIKIENYLADKDKNHCSWNNSPVTAYLVIVGWEQLKCIAASRAEEKLFTSVWSSEYTKIAVPCATLILARVSAERFFPLFAWFILARVSAEGVKPVLPKLGFFSPRLASRSFALASRVSIKPREEPAIFSILNSGLRVLLSRDQLLCLTIFKNYKNKIL